MVLLSQLQIFWRLLLVWPWRMTKYVLPDFFESDFNFSIESTIVRSPSAVVQIGSGVPQYRSRENAQSLTSRSHSPNRPSRICDGSQLMPSFSDTSVSRSFDIATYQLSRA